MLILELEDFSIEQIADSGQCFRMYRTADDTWGIFALNRFLKIQQRNKFNVFHCNQDEFDKFWREYFDLDTDYSYIKNRIISTGDEYLIKAVKYGSGLRILKQNLWEMIVSAVISQRNNIPRIKGCLKKLCEINDERFPTAKDFLRFSKSQLASVSLGYREKYLLEISKVVANKQFDLELLKSLPYDQAFIALKSLYGVGDKVANCIALFGLYKIEAFPIDVWIQRIIQQRYNNNFSLEQKGLQDIAGIVQQYMFFYERRLSQH